MTSATSAPDLPTPAPTLAAPPTILAVKAFGITDKGKVRASNEDQFLIAELTKSMRVWQTSLPEPSLQVGEQHAHLFLVADGMGGHQAGERASALAVAAIEQFMLNRFKWFFESDPNGAQKVLAQFQNALQQADAHIVHEAVGHPELSGMGTTVTMAFVLGAQLCILHVGDSRAYLFRGGQLDQVTHDDTLTADLVSRGVLRPDQAKGHHLKHIITNVVGGQEAGVRVEAHAFELLAGDCLLLCSDGLLETVTDEAITETLSTESSPEAAVKRLFGQASDGAARDNITVLVARFD